MDWKDIKIDGISSIDKCVAEFEVGELIKTPYAKFKVKIYQRQNKKFHGRTNLKIKDNDNNCFGEVGHGETIEEALIATIQYFLKELNSKSEWNVEDFEAIDPYDF